MCGMSGYNVDDIIWYNLGYSYGWWPAQIQDQAAVASLSSDLLSGLGEEFSSQINETDQDSLYIKFFDDDGKEWIQVHELTRIKKYSCKDKKRMIRKGFKTLDESKRNGLGGVNLRLAQFYKDVELAEVLTDNEPEVAAILSLYEVREEEPQVEENIERKAVDGRKKPAGKQKDVLREIKNGRIARKKSSGRRKKSTK